MKHHPEHKRERADAGEECASLIGLGRAVERLRVDAELTRDAVAKRGELAGTTVSHIEKHLKRQPNWGTMRRLAKGLGVELDVLVRLGIEFAPGEAGERLRRREREARDIDVEAVAQRALEEGEEERA